MYSILPAFVAALFLGYGIYAVCTKGMSRTTLSFFVVCITSFFWQGTWAILFQVKDAQLATFLVKLGYFFILFLPTSLYHFLAEISECQDERRYVYLSYAVAGTLALFLISGDLLVAGHYNYFWGYYPKAGLLHPIHVLQTVVVVNRGLYLNYRQRSKVPPYKRTKLNLCIGGVLTYFFAAVDYACNYGIEFYPPGVVFIAVSLGIITIAVAKYDLLNPMAVAATVAHEVRTPLVSIRMQAKGIDRYLPALLHGYQLAVRHGLCEPSIRPQIIDHLSCIGSAITEEIDRTNIAIDMLLASIKTERFDRSTFGHHSVEHCIKEALNRYTFESGERALVHVAHMEEFWFYGSDTLLILVLFNLLKNALHSIREAGKGRIEISTRRSAKYIALDFKDTGAGVEPSVISHIFEPFYTTKKNSSSGLGLAFCRRVMTSFDGCIRCESVHGEYTVFTLEFPAGADLDKNTLPPTKRTRSPAKASLSTFDSA